jgi:hypothetical protein
MPYRHGLRRRQQSDIFSDTHHLLCFSGLRSFYDCRERNIAVQCHGSRYWELQFCGYVVCERGQHQCKWFAYCSNDSWDDHHHS